MSVYTRTGDKGKTSLYGGKRISKADPRVQAYGEIDELNSCLGIAIAQASGIKSELIQIQKDLFEIGTRLANPGQREDKKFTNFLSARVEEFEKTIDNLTKKLPPLENFILPGGGGAGAHLHLARSISRRAERSIVMLSEKEKVGEEILIYLNRLSDLLFMFARFVNHKGKNKEIVWSKR